VSQLPHLAWCWPYRSPLLLLNPSPWSHPIKPHTCDTIVCKQKTTSAHWNYSWSDTITYFFLGGGGLQFTNEFTGSPTQTSFFSKLLISPGTALLMCQVVQCLGASNYKRGAQGWQTTVCGQWCPVAMCLRAVHLQYIRCTTSNSTTEVLVLRHISERIRKQVILKENFSAKF
jgi:hypothetical protein